MREKTSPLAFLILSNGTTARPRELSNDLPAGTIEYLDLRLAKGATKHHGNTRTTNKTGV